MSWKPSQESFSGRRSQPHQTRKQSQNQDLSSSALALRRVVGALLYN